jgi:signal transduction histidine kinase
MERLTVLYVEDNPQDIELTRRHLRRHAAHVDLQTASTARECLQRLEQESFDAVLMDYRLPDRDGLELLRDIREQSLPVAVVMLTGSGDPETAVAALQGGAHDYLVKQGAYLDRLAPTLEKAVGVYRAAQTARERVHVLYAEHSPADIELTLRHCRLRAPHLDIEVVTNGPDALVELEQHPYDILLLDYKMPELDGVAVLAEMARRKLAVPAVLVTGQGDEGTAVQALKAGAMDYIVKREGYLFRLPSALEHALARYRLAAEKAILERRVEERTREVLQVSQRLAVLAAVAARIQRRLNLNELFADLARELKGLGWDSAIALAQPAGVLHVAHHSLDQEAVTQASALAGGPLPATVTIDGGTLLGRAFAGTELRFIKRPLHGLKVYLRHTGLLRTADVAALAHVLGLDERTRALVAPLVTDDRQRGLFVVWGANLSENDVPAVRAFSGQIAVAIENARLHESLRARRIEEQAALLRLSEELLATLYLQEVMERAAGAAVGILGADFAGVFLPTGGGELVLRAGVGIGAGSLAGLRLPVAGNDPAGRALRDHVLVVAADREQAEAFREYGLHAGLVVPLLAGGAALGVLSIHSAAARAFDEDDTRIAALIAGQAAVALERARLYEAEQRRAAQLGLLREVGQDIMALLDPDRLLQHIVEQVRTRFRYAHVGIFLVDAERHELVRRASSPQPDKPRDVLRIRIGREGITGWVAANAQPLLVSDVTHDERFVYDAENIATRSELAVPILAREVLLGVLDVQSARRDDFSEDDLFILQALAQQIAIALENARLYEEARRHAAEVSTLLLTTAAISTPLELELRLEAIAHHARNLAAADGCVVYRLAPGGDVLHPLVALGAYGEARTVRSVKVGEGPTGRAARERSGETTRGPWGDGLAWQVSVPLLAGEDMLGVMTLARTRGEQSFTDHDVDLLTSFATQAALAIQIAELIDALRARAQSLQEAYDRLAEADRLKDELVQNISHELRTPLTFVKGYVELMLARELGPLTPLQLDSMQLMANKTDAIIRLVDDVVTLQALSTGGLARQKVDLSELARHAAGRLAPVAARAGVQLHCDLPVEPVVAEIDASRIGQVLDSLLSNAIKFSPDGGEVMVRVRRDGDEARFEVVDRGVGIAPEKLMRIFDRFYQADGSTTRRFGGVGLGLAIVKEIVELHGGVVEVESEEGQGSTFRVRLPVTAPPVPAEAEPQDGG